MRNQNKQSRSETTKSQNKNKQKKTENMWNHLFNYDRRLGFEKREDTNIMWS